MQEYAKSFDRTAQLAMRGKWYTTFTVLPYHMAEAACFFVEGQSSQSTGLWAVSTTSSWFDGQPQQPQQLRLPSARPSAWHTVPRTHFFVWAQVRLPWGDGLLLGDCRAAQQDVAGDESS